MITTLKRGEVIGDALPFILTGNLKEEFEKTPIKGQNAAPFHPAFEVIVKVANPCPVI